MRTAPLAELGLRHPELPVGPWNGQSTLDFGAPFLEKRKGLGLGLGLGLGSKLPICETRAKLAIPRSGSRKVLSKVTSEGRLEVPQGPYKVLRRSSGTLGREDLRGEFRASFADR